MKPLIWQWHELAILTHCYPTKGKVWCAEALGRSVHAVRTRAHSLRLKMTCPSPAEMAARENHSARLTGRKRPDQALVMRKLHTDGKLGTLSPESRRAQAESLKAWHATHEHPRGAKGHRHSPEVLAAISRASAVMHAARSPEQKSAIVMKRMKTRHALGILALPRPGTSWKASWQEIGGVRKFYRSRWEANYARYLEWQKSQGQIASWLHEPDVFWFEGIRRGCVSYLPDFKVTYPDGRVEYHEVKGWMDDRSKTKIRRMAKYHPTVKLVVIDKRAYAQLSMQLRWLVPGWE